MNIHRTPTVLRALLPLLAAACPTLSAHAGVTVIEAGADSRTEVGIGAPPTVKRGPSARSFDATVDPYILSKSDSRDDRYLYRVIDSAGSAVSFTDAARADFFVRSSVNADAGVGEFQFPAHGAASGNAFYQFTVDTPSKLSLTFSAFASAQPSAYAYVALDVFTVDERTHAPKTYLRLGPIAGTDTLSYDVGSGSYGLSLTAFSQGDIPARISTNTQSNSGAVANLSLSVSAVPEPATAALFALGLAGVCTLRASRRAQPRA
jgi:hypothetical protein